MRRFWLAAAVMITVTAVFAIWLWQMWGGAFATRVVDDVGLLAFAACAGGCSLLAARRSRGRQRASWLAMAAGLGGWAVGEAIWCYYDLVRSGDQVPFPSAADAGYLMFPVGAGIALLLFPAGHSQQSRTRLIFDGLLVAGSLFVVSWVSALGSVYGARSNSGFAFVVSLAYPVADLVIMTMAIVVLARAHTAQRLSLALMAIGIMLMAVSDSGFAYLTASNSYASGNLIDLGWAAAFCLVGLAAWSSTPHASTDSDPIQVPTQARLWLPYVPVLVAAGVGANRLLRSLNAGPIPVVAMLVLGVLLARQLIVLAENRRLLLIVTRQALRDSLTGLANRALFLDRLNQAVQRQRRELTPLAVLCLDLDDFKLVNDNLGHAAGDELLIRVAERLTGCLRTTDTVARLGGDEFAILVEEGAADALHVAHRVAEAFTAPFILDGRPLAIRPSIGLTIADATACAVSTEELLKQADLAMYSAKRAGAGGVHTFVPVTPSASSASLRRRGPVLHPA